MHVLEINMCYQDTRDVSQTPIRCNLQPGTIKQRIVRSVIIAQNGFSLRRQGHYFYYTSTPTRVTCHVSHPLHFIAITSAPFVFLTVRYYTHIKRRRGVSNRWRSRVSKSLSPFSQSVRSSRQRPKRLAAAVTMSSYFH